MHNNNNSNQWIPNNKTYWSREEDKIFEQALLNFSDETDDRWHLISTYLPGKTPNDVMIHYDDLVYDVAEIEAGRVEPPYSDEYFQSQISFGSGRTKTSTTASSSDCAAVSERKKGIPWTEEEHRLFLQGLEKYGKGDWRSISRNVVVTRTPTQVASHAQKYFQRHTSGKKERKRSSIHDITTPAAMNNSSAMPSPTNLPNSLQFQGGYQDFGFPNP